MIKAAVIYGSVRSARKGIRAAKYIMNKCKEREIEPVLIDAAEYDLPILDKMYKEYPEGEAPKDMQKISNILNGSDGFIIVSGEYNHSIPPALSNLMDHFQREFYFKPSAIVSYSAGAFAGVRAAVHLRAFLAELGTSSIPTTLPVPKVQQLFDENANLTDDKFERRTKKFLDEFIWYLEALKNKRDLGLPY